MGHDHHNNLPPNNLKVAFFLNLGFTVLEILGGLYVNSVAIISDAIHDLGDSISLGTAWYLERKSRQRSDQKFSFGYQRFSLLGALVTCITLIAGSIFVIREAVGRLIVPEQTHAGGMLVFAIIGVVVNGYAAWKLSSGRTLNEKMASWHLLEDVLGWLAVLVVSIILLFKDIPYLDPALSLLITLYILWNVVKRLKETLYIFLQGVPSEIKISDIEKGLLDIQGVESLHHTHIWSLEGAQHVFTTHLKLGDIESLNELLTIKDQVKKVLGGYGFKHYTVETELDKERCGLSLTEDELRMRN